MKTTMFLFLTACGVQPKPQPDDLLCDGMGTIDTLDCVVAHVNAEAGCEQLALSADKTTIVAEKSGMVGHVNWVSDLSANIGGDAIGDFDPKQGGTYYELFYDWANTPPAWQPTLVIHELGHMQQLRYPTSDTWHDYSHSQVPGDIMFWESNPGNVMTVANFKAYMAQLSEQGLLCDRAAVMK